MNYYSQYINGYTIEIFGNKIKINGKNVPKDILKRSLFNILVNSIKTKAIGNHVVIKRGPNIIEFKGKVVIINGHDITDQIPKVDFDEKYEDEEIKNEDKPIISTEKKNYNMGIFNIISTKVQNYYDDSDEKSSTLKK